MDDSTESSGTLQAAFMGVGCVNLSITYLYIDTFHHPPALWTALFALVAIFVLATGILFVAASYFRARRAPRSLFAYTVNVFGMVLAGVLVELVKIGDQQGFLLTIAGVAGAILVGVAFAGTQQPDQNPKR